MSSFWQDCRYTARILARAPGFTAVAVLLLGLGIGLNTAIFTLAQAFLFNPLPYENPRAIMMLYHWKKGWSSSVSFQELQDWRQHNQSFEELAGVRRVAQTLTGMGEAERIQGMSVSAGFFRVFGVKPALGRASPPQDDQPGARGVAVITHGFWQRRFGERAEALGKTLTIDGRNYAIVGIMPPDFNFDATEYLLPLGREAPRGRTLDVSGRLKPGMAQATAQAEMEGLVRAAVHAMDRDQPIASIRSMDAVIAESLVIPRTMSLLMGILAALALVLAVVGIYGVVSYSVSRRTHELGVRMALGADHWSVLRLVMRQAAVLTGIGLAIGTVAGIGVTHLLRSMIYGVSAWDPLVLAGAPPLLALVALAASHIPARRAVRVDPLVALRYE